ncbi:MAG: ABC transporter ATP-binding protein [Clostridia bacterium]|jgi:ABC-type lipoprotein export system ATPase subunit
MNIINIKNLNKIYKGKADNNVKALDNMCLEIDSGEFVAIEGTSGSGKSTLLHILAGIDEATSGSVFINGKDITKFKNNILAKHRNKTIGIVLQEFFLIDYRTVIDNVIVPLLFCKNSISQMYNKADKILDTLGIKNLKNRKINELSGGQKQRVAIARALINDPDILLADEPTGSLDSKTTKEILDVFSYFNNLGKTTIIVTHDPLVSGCAQRVIKIEDGAVKK